MKKLVLFLGLWLSSAQAQPINQYVAAGAFPFGALSYCQITSLGSAVAMITASCATGTISTSGNIFEICVETAGIRYRDDGTAPTASVGMPVVPASSSIPACFQYSGGKPSALQFIALSGSPVVDIIAYAGGH